FQAALLLHRKLNPDILPDSVSSTVESLFRLEEKNGTIPEPMVLLPTGSDWHYATLENPPPLEDWFASRSGRQSDHWPVGKAPFGFGQDKIETALKKNGSHSSTESIWPAYFFRRVFEVPASAATDNLRLRIRRDDGLRVFLNGTEILRDNIAPGHVEAGTLATMTIPENENNRYRMFDLPGATVKQGPNVIAVELRQSTDYSSDLAFDLELLSGITTLADYLEQVDRSRIIAYTARSGQNIGEFMAEKIINARPEPIR
ncbi:MAG: hypothetical protein AAF514_04285, partial [Verrucomicrobiota bacterium]